MDESIDDLDLEDELLNESENNALVQEEENIDKKPDKDNNSDVNSTRSKRKSGVRKPKPKLDPDRLKGPRGLSILPSYFKDKKFKGRGYEKEDLNSIMSSLELWAHRLYPRFKFDDTINRIEQLGHKSQVSTYMNKLRLDLLDNNQTNEENISADEDFEFSNKEEIQLQPTDDVFDRLLNLNEQRFNSSIDTNLQDDVTKSFQSTVCTNLQPTLTQEQKERINQNRLLAEQRRLAKLEEKKKEILLQSTASEEENV